MKKTFLLIPTLLLSILGTVLGNKPEMEKIPQDANFIMHLDIEAFRSSKVGDFMLQEMLKVPQMEQKMTGLKNAFGVDIDQLGFVTAHGSGNKDEIVAFLKGGFNSKQLEGFASLNDKIEISKFNGQKLYSAPKGAFSVLGPDSIIAATNEKLLKSGLKARLGKTEKQEKNPILDHLNEMVEKPIAVVTAQIPKLIKMAKTAKSISATEQAIMEKLDWAGLALGESGASIRIACVMNAENIETAEHMENILRGVTSLLSLNTEIKPLLQNEPKLNKILPHIKTSVSRKSQIVGMQLEMDSSILIEMIGIEMAKKRQEIEKKSTQE